MTGRREQTSEPKDVSLEERRAEALDKKVAALRHHIQQACLAGRPGDIYRFEDLDQTFPALPLQEAYYAIQELGLADSTDLLALATPEQVQGFLDLDVWRKDLLDSRRMLRWTDVLLQLPLEKLAQVIEHLDPEIVALLVARSCRILDMTLEVLPQNIIAGPWRTPDSFYALIPHDKDHLEDYHRACRLLDRLYAADMELAHKVVKTARWEPPAELEEMSYRWRSGRIMDLGFADYYEAIEVYSYLKPTAVKIGENTADPPLPEDLDVAGMDLVQEAQGDRRDFLAACLARIEDPAEMRRIGQAAATLANKMMAADLVENPDYHLAAHYMARMRRYLSIGLERLTGGDPNLGPKALATISLARILRVGYSLTLDLKRLVMGLRSAGRISLAPTGTTLLDEPWEALVRGLEQRRPELTRAFDDPPGEGFRPFSSMADLAFALRLVEDLANQWSLCFEKLRFPLDILSSETLKSCMPASPAQVTLGDIFRTALLNHLIGAAPSPRPLSEHELARAKSALAQVRRKRPLWKTASNLVEGILKDKGQTPPPRLDRILRTWTDPLQARNREQLAAWVITKKPDAHD